MTESEFWRLRCLVRTSPVPPPDWREVAEQMLDTIEEMSEELGRQGKRRKELLDELNGLEDDIGDLRSDLETLRGKVSG
jgi:archaellum component FlaC